MRRLGFLIAAVGIVVVFAALMMDTTIATEGGARVSNLGLMADRQLYTLLGGFVLVAGVVMALLASRHLSAPPTTPSLFKTRPCPDCAEPIKQTAVMCKHCSAKVAPQVSPKLVNGWVATVKYKSAEDLAQLKSAISTEGYPAVSMKTGYWGAGPFATREEAQEALADLQANHGLRGGPEYRDSLSGTYPAAAD